MFTAQQARKEHQYESLDIEKTLEMISKDVEIQSKFTNFSAYEFPINPSALRELKKRLEAFGYNIIIQDVGKVRYSKQYSDFFVDWSRMLGGF